jgi:hypothetical protein
MVSGREVGRIRPLGMDTRKARRFVQEMRQGRWSMDSSMKVKAEPECHTTAASSVSSMKIEKALSLIQGSKIAAQDYSR